MRRYCVIADDFTGAGDTGIQFLKYGLPATVEMAEQSGTGRDDSRPVRVLDTETRNTRAEEAEAVLERLCERLENTGAVFYKKTDSTLRGPIAAEVAVLARRLDLPVVFAPAYPAQGRTVEQGRLLVRGTPVTQTAIAKDPLAPVRTDVLTELLAGQQGLRPRHVANATEAAQVLRTEDRAGLCVCCDAASQEDLEQLAVAVTSVLPPEEVLWVGSAGLALALLSHLETPGAVEESVAASATAQPGLPALAVVGSVHPAGREQVRAVLAAQGGTVLHPRLEALPEQADQETERLAAALKEALCAAGGGNVILQAAPQAEDVRPGLSHAVAGVLSGAVAVALRDVRVRGLFVTGGEMAVHVLRRLECGRVHLRREVAPGIPSMTLADGLVPGLPMISKAGGFGGADTLRVCLRSL